MLFEQCYAPEWNDSMGGGPPKMPSNHSSEFNGPHSQSPYNHFEHYSSHFSTCAIESYALGVGMLPAMYEYPGAQGHSHSCPQKLDRAAQRLRGPTRHNLDPVSSH